MFPKATNSMEVVSGTEAGGDDQNAVMMDLSGVGKDMAAVVPEGWGKVGTSIAYSLVQEFHFGGHMERRRHWDTSNGDGHGRSVLLDGGALRGKG